MSIILRVGAVKPLRGQETQYGSGDEASVSYTDADVLDIPLPEHTYQRPLPAVFSQPQSNTSYFGLPYQDHNYGMPPPPSPPRAATPEPPSPLQVNGVVQMEEEVKTSPLVSVVEEVVEDSITRCICGYLHDDGYMICCDKCSVWQHIDCVGVDRNNIPDNYFCELCQPRVLDSVKAKVLQKKKREELAARNVLSDSSATDTDPEEAANALASMVKKLPVQKRKGLKQKRTKVKDKPQLKLKIGKTGVPKKLKKPGKKEKENIKAIKSKKIFKPGVRKLKEFKSRPLMVAEQINTDPWNSTASPWVDEYEYIQENLYSDDVIVLSSDTMHLFQSEDFPTFSPTQLQAQLVSVSEVKKNRKGLKAIDHIYAGQGVIEYTGKVMLKQEYDQQYAVYKPTTVLQPFVLFHSKSDIFFCVDATMCGNESRFIRRSCTPNAEVQLQYRDKKIHFVILAKKDISLGVEVTISFDYDYHTSSACIECACLRNNCVISRFWKKKKKILQKEFTGRRRRQSSGEGSKKSQDQRQKIASPQSSPRKISSPAKALDIRPTPASPTNIVSPIRLSVSTLLAASALLEAQSEAIADVKPIITNDSLQPSLPYVKPATSPPHRINASQRRASRTSESDSKDEKTTAMTHQSVTHPKEKTSKVKEPKIKVKENKEPQHVPVPVEVKKERRLSSRRQSQEDVLEESPVKEEGAPFPEDKEDAAAAENYRKMTREERKMDAIMKAFEKMEKREERRKEAGGKKGPEPKGKRDETDSRTRSISQDGSVDDEVKVEVDEQPVKFLSNDVKQEPSAVSTPSLPLLPLDVPTTEPKPVVKEEPTTTITTATTTTTTTQRLPRKLGKRRRRRSRVQTAPALIDSAGPIQSDESSNSIALPLMPSPIPIPPAPASAPLPTTVSSVEPEGEEFKYVKSKKHLFNEWSHKHDDEAATKQEEMFVECLPSPRVNAMDHLQRRNSHSASYTKAIENGGGFAKKRWLRQAMHEEPNPVAFNYSLSVTTDNGSASPIHGSISPNNGVTLSSPGASSPIDFVTPLKKRRLIRESMSTEDNGPVHSPSPGVFSENMVVDVPKTNGLKSFLPAHRHSVDDRLLLHKSYPHQNGFREASGVSNAVGLFKKTANSTPSSVSVCLKFDSTQSKSEGSEKSTVISNGLNHKVPDLSTAVASSNHSINGFSSASDCITSVSLSPSRPSQVVSLRVPYERMETESDKETSDNEPLAKMYDSGGNSGVCSLTSSNSNNFETDATTQAENSSTSSTSAPRQVVVNSVYNDVNNLLETSREERGYVVTKSIMEADGPATVCVDLNVHVLEPSPLTTGECKTVVDLDKGLFSLEAVTDQQQEQGSEARVVNCQVNSSEDISSNGVPLRQHDHTSTSSCDIPGPGSSSDTQAHPSPPDVPLSGSGQNSNNTSNSSSSGGNTDNFKQEVQYASLSSVESEDDSSFKNGFESISSSSHTDTVVTLEETRTAECDSAEVVSEVEPIVEGCVEMAVSESPSSEGILGQCDSGSSGIGPTDTGCEAMEVDQDRSCDSVGNYNVTSALVSSDSQVEEEVMRPEPDGQSEGVSNSRQEDSNLQSEDTNVDSTSSVPVQPGRFSFSPTSESETPSTSSGRTAQGSVMSFCDSNSERDSSSRAIERESSASSSSEEVGVSSSSTLQTRPRNAEVATTVWEEGDDECAEAVLREAVPDNATSARSPLPSPTRSGYQSPGSVVSSNSGNNNNNNIANSSSVFEPAAEACSSSSICASSNANSSSASNSNGVVSSNTFSSPPPSRGMSSSSPLGSPPFAVGSPEESTALNNNLVSTSSTSDQEGPPQSSSTSPSTSSSSSEAVPAVKKKVSLLEYRMRLKKPPATTASETKTSPPVSQPCTTVTLSSVCERFLSSSPSSTSTPSYSSSAISPHRKHRMPTLATLPLFKSSEKKKEEKKPVIEKKKVEKQLSLSERLRLEFGVDVSIDDSKAQSDTDRRSNRGQSSSPPPPPPPLPFPTTAGLDPGKGNNVHRDSSAVDSSTTKDEAIPPPPPPPRSYPYSAKTVSRPTSSFSASSSIPGVSYAGPLVNGGISSSHSHPQQSSISSTSVPSHLRDGSGGTTYPPPPPPLLPPSSSSSPASHPSSVVPGYQSLLPQQQSPASAASISPSSSSSSSTSSSSHKPSSMAGSAVQWPLKVASPPPPSLHHHPHHHPSGSLSSSSNNNAQPSSSTTSNSHQQQQQPGQSHLPHSHHSYDYHHTIVPPPSQSQSQTAAVVPTGNSIADDNPPPPPPPLNPRTHSHHSSSSSSSSLASSSSSSHRHSSSSHRRYESSDRNKKAASSSSSSSHHYDKRSRY